MAHYLNPKYSLPFRRVFGEHKHLCISLINNLLPLEKPVVQIEYQSGELIPDLDVLRNTIVDVNCTDSDGRQFLVEMQLYWNESFKQRVLLNASKAYVRQLDKAMSFSLLKPVYALSFVNDEFEKSKAMKDVYYHHYRIVNVMDTEKQIEGLEFVFLELPKFKPQNRAEKKLHELWLRFLTEINESTTEISNELQEDALISEALRLIEKAAYTKEELAQYDKWKIDLLTSASMLEEAEAKGKKEGEAKGLEKGKALGLEEGKALGLEEGKALGLEEGKALERKKTINIARNLLEKGISIEDVSDATGLSIDEINELKKQ